VPRVRLTGLGAPGPFWASAAAHGDDRRTSPAGEDAEPSAASRTTASPGTARRERLCGSPTIRRKHKMRREPAHVSPPAAQRAVGHLAGLPVAPPCSIRSLTPEARGAWHTPIGRTAAGPREGCCGTHKAGPRAPAMVTGPRAPWREAGGAHQDRWPAAFRRRHQNYRFRLT
jgi:hypothetical protein